MISHIQNARLNPIRQHAMAVHALMLRDIKTRIGGSYFGYLSSLLFPLGHLGIVLGFYVIMGKAASIGTDVAIYLATAILPFIIWSYTHQKMMRSFVLNAPLLAFPVIRLMDIAISCALVEIISATTIACILFASFLILGFEVSIFDQKGAFFTVFLAYSLGVSSGFLFGVLSLINSTISIAGYLLIPLYWLTSGLFFTPDSLPGKLRFALSIFPVAHIVDLARINVYSSYASDFVNLNYIYAIIIFNTMIAFLIQSIFRTQLIKL